jgi:hypothetical protein
MIPLWFGYKKMELVTVYKANGPVSPDEDPALEQGFKLSLS